MSRYDDIIHLPRPVSSTRARMSNYDRAAQFSPFAALVGYEAAIGEAGRLTQQRITLAEGAAEDINACLLEIQSCMKEKPAVRVICFCPDDRKAGGAYLTKQGYVCKIDNYRKILLLEPAIEIPFADIVEICLLGKTEKL